MDTQMAVPEHQDQASKLFLEHYNYIRFIAFQTAPRRDLVGDIVNSTFLVFVKKADQWNLEEDIKPLLREITKNVARQQWNEWLRYRPESLRRIAEYVQSDISSAEELLGQPLLDEEISALGLCLGKLPEESRKLIEDYYYNRIPIARIAERTGRKPLTLGKVFSRLREKLRKCMERVLKGMGYGHD